MWGVSAAFSAALAASHPVAFRADVLRGGSVIASGLRVTEGSVEVDGNADVRRRCSVTVVDPTGALIPVGAAVDTLAPYGNELRIYRGVNDELVPLGTFRIASAKVSDEGVIAVEGFDRARAVARARFESPYLIAAGQVYSTEIGKLIGDRLPGTPFEVRGPVPASTTPVLLFEQGADPWKSAQAMATALGAELFFDPMGVCVLQPVPDPLSDAVTASYVEGQTATVLSVDNALSDEPGYNGVVVDGEAPGFTPVHAVIYDTDPTSPTDSGGPYGKVPMFYRSQFITDLSQATTTAAAMLRANRGGTEQMTFEAIPNPAHEAGDVVRVARRNISVDANYLVESFGIPLKVDGVMRVTTRKRR